MEDLTFKRVTNEDTFQFQCSRCTKCCRSIYQCVMTSTYDLFRIARFEGRHMEEVVMDYTEPVLVSYQPIPIMMLKTVGTGKDAACILLDKRKCKIQEVKPLVCRLYPLNLEPAKGLERLIPCIVSQRKHHYTGKTHVVGDWLKENMDEIDETATIWWYKAAGELGKILKGKNQTMADKEFVLRATIIRLYIYYDYDRDFLTQYATNLNKLLNDLRDHFER